MKTKIEKYRKGIMGTLEFDMKLPKMRKFQDFIVYPIGPGETVQKVKVQSDTRIGYVHLDTGLIQMTGSYPGGAYFHHLAFDLRDVEVMTPEALEEFKEGLRVTAGSKVGKSVIFSDNSGAFKI